jgi:hypothetical protein
MSKPAEETLLIGRRVIDVGAMAPDELVTEAWDLCPWEKPPAVVMLDDGTILYSSRDGEGNGPGLLFERTRGRSFALLAE